MFSFFCCETKWLLCAQNRCSSVRMLTKECREKCVDTNKKVPSQWQDVDAYIYVKSEGRVNVKFCATAYIITEICTFSVFSENSTLTPWILCDLYTILLSFSILSGDAFPIQFPAPMKYHTFYLYRIFLQV